MKMIYDTTRKIPHRRVRKYPLRGTKFSVAASMVKSPNPLARSDVEKCSEKGVDVCSTMYVPEMPIPRRILSMGPPKQAENPIIGANT
jgi:hypothetical protein